MYDPQSLYENSRNQFESRGASDKKIDMKMSKKICFISTIYLSSSTKLHNQEEKPNLWLFTWKEKRRVQYSPKILGFHKPPEKLDSVSFDS